MSKILLSSIFTFSVLCFSAFSLQVDRIGSSEPPIYKDDTVYVHVIPHTHDDVGWLKTVDEYYSGSRKKDAQGNVHMILDNVMTELLNDPSKRFTYVETKFFSMWWEEQT